MAVAGGFSGFSQASTQQMAAQVAAAKATADQVLRDMRARSEGGGAGHEKSSSSRMSADLQVTAEKVVGRHIVEHLMTPEHRLMLEQESGAQVEWSLGDRKAKLTGSRKAISTAARFLDRVQMHCHWGASRDKVRRLLRRSQGIESVLVRLSPMTVNHLLPAQKTFSGSETTLTMGKDKQNDVVIQDAAVSRHHCVISFEPAKGGIYVADLSTNGTYLNGVRLPSKKLAGKVLLSHGDELLFKDPAAGDAEFGYICNLNEISVKAEVRLEAPRRLLTPEEQSTAIGY